MNKLVCPKCEGERTLLGIGADRNGDQNEHSCTMCLGEGEVNHPGPCDECDGAKVLVCDHDPEDKTECPTCDGKGYALEVSPW